MSDMRECAGEPAPDHPEDEPDNELVYKDVKVLILTFAFNDFKHQLDLETESVANIFIDLGYSVEKFPIPMIDSLSRLRKELDRFFSLIDDETLSIIYYNGHGGLSKSKKSLVFNSHNYPDDIDKLQGYLVKLWNDLDDVNVPRRGMIEDIKLFQPIAEVSWRDISDVIILAKCDTLVILDCCDAGLATVRALTGDVLDDDEQDEGSWLPFRKELIGACTWENKTADRMSGEMCNALRTLLLNEAHPDARSSGHTLIREMNNLLAEHFLQNDERYVAQAVHFLLRRTTRERILLENRNT